MSSYSGNTIDNTSNHTSNDAAPNKFAISRTMAAVKRLVKEDTTKGTPRMRDTMSPRRSIKNWDAKINADQPKIHRILSRVSERNEALQATPQLIKQSQSFDVHDV